LNDGNKAFDSLKLNLDLLTMDSELSNIAPLPEKTVSFKPVVGTLLGSGSCQLTGVEQRRTVNLVRGVWLHEFRPQAEP
jgi:hypothetical protein